MKNFFWMIFLVMTATLAGCNAPPATPPPAASATDSAPTSLILAGGVVASAEALPAQDTQMSFLVSAPVKEVLVKEGDVVMAGQTLLTIYSPDLELAVTAAELDAQAAELEFQYWIPARLDRPPERRQQAEAELEESRAQLETAKANFTQTSLSAPFNAVVVEVKIQPGEFAQAGQVVIVLGDLAHMQIKTTDLSERDVPAVQIGQTANVYIEALDVTVTGKVIQISPISETVGGDVVYPVTIELDEQLAGLLWGMSAEVEISDK
ncbi:MAG: HlyD family efflux transporter periplasmic adaptor subunit [Anaerolineales bacterium]|nr:HlyD family efflux transporter periplasmic adaptor subunit [Anaerolineales bacterium]